MGLFNVTVLDEEFYQCATEDKALTIDKLAKTLQIEGVPRKFGYTHSYLEETLLEAGGILNLYDIHGLNIFRNIVRPKAAAGKQEQVMLEKNTQVAECGDPNLLW